MARRLTNKDVEGLRPGDELVAHPDESLGYWEVDACTFVALSGDQTEYDDGEELHSGSCTITIKNPNGQEWVFFCSRFCLSRKIRRYPLDKIIEIWL